MLYGEKAMKKFVFILVIFLLTASISISKPAYKGYEGKERHSNILEHVDIDLEDGNLIITPEDADEPVVEITSKYELYIDGLHIETNAGQRVLIVEYYDLFNEIVREAKIIGMEGAKIGVEGAALGISAVAKAFKLISDDYDTEDLEREIEKEAEKLELKAEVLEKKAEIIEDMGEEFEQLHLELKDSIDELSELEWF